MVIFHIRYVLKDAWKSKMELCAWFMVAVVNEVLWWSKQSEIRVGGHFSPEKITCCMRPNEVTLTNLEFPEINYFPLYRFRGDRFLMYEKNMSWRYHKDLLQKVTQTLLDPPSRITLSDLTLAIDLWKFDEEVIHSDTVYGSEIQRSPVSWGW